MAKVLEWKASFERSGRFPLDIDSVFSDSAATENYVTANTRAYVGQIVAVTGGTESGIYRITQIGEGGKVVKLYDENDIKVKDVKVDELSVVDENGIANINLSNYATLETLEKDYATKADLTNYVTNKSLENTLNGYATKDDLDGYIGEEILKKYATKGELNNYIPYSNLLTEIPGNEDDLDKKVVSAKFVSDKLSAIDSKISNFSLFEVVAELPTNEEDIKKNKIYLVPDIPEFINNSGNTFTEYIYTTDNSGNSRWEIIGYYTANSDINLNDYVKREEYNDLLSRVEALEALVTGSSDAKLITTENINKYAVVNVESDDNIEAIKDDNGILTIKFIKITNEAYDNTNV